MAISGEVKIESRYKYFPGVSTLDGLEVKALGIGSVNTWHGGTELRVDGCDIVLTDQELRGEDEGSVSRRDVQHSHLLSKGYMGAPFHPRDQWDHLRSPPPPPQVMGLP